MNWNDLKRGQLYHLSWNVSPGRSGWELVGRFVELEVSFYDVVEGVAPPKIVVAKFDVLTETFPPPTEEETKIGIIGSALGAFSSRRTIRYPPEFKARASRKDDYRIDPIPDTDLPLHTGASVVYPSFEEALKKL